MNGCTHGRGGEAVVSLKHHTSTALPPDFGDVTGTEDEYLSASIRPVGMSESGNQRGNVFGLRTTV
jgi:hypothetical protein